MPGLGNSVDASVTGFQSLNAATGVWNGRTFVAGAGMSITNADGTGGNPTFSASGAFTSVVQQVFTANGTYTPTAGMLYCQVQMVGGGGAGGGVALTGVGQANAGGGGGGGEYAEAIFSAAQIGVSKAVTIGAGGVGAAGAIGGAGGVTSLGALLNCNGGAGGSIQASTTNTGAAGGGGGGTGGGGAPGASYRLDGQFGGTAYYSVPAFLDIAGNSGGSFFGVGYQNVITNGSLSFAGFSPTTYGAGGGGAVNQASQAARAGGNGMSGVVIITEYI